MQIKILSVCRRPAIAGLMFVLVLTGAFFLGQAQAQQPPQPVTYDSPTVIYVQIKADKTADYEAVIAKLKEALQKSDKPEVKQQVAGWRIYKQMAPGPNNTSLYLHVIDPAVPNVDYSVIQVLYAAFPADSQALYNQYKEAFVGQSPSKMTLVADLGK